MFLSSLQTLRQRTRAYKKTIRLAWSGVILLALLGVLCAELVKRENLEVLWAAFVAQCSVAHWGWLLVVLLLMPVNWWAETCKWQPFLRRYEPLSSGRALLAVWVGAAFSLFTPNRMGEYGGRLLFVQPANRWKAVLINIVGSYSQLLVIGLAGIWGLACCDVKLAWAPWLSPLSALALGVWALAFLMFFHIGPVWAFFQKIVPRRSAPRFLREFELLQTFGKRDLVRILGWSALRYGVYATQYFLLLRFFGVSPGPIAGYAGIALLFLVQTYLPLPPVAALVARGHLALWWWPQFGGNELGSVAAPLVLWIINLILPALIGTFSLFFVYSANTSEYENT